MPNRALVALAAPLAALTIGGSALAQTAGQDAFRQFLGAVLGQVTSMDAQWQRNQRPLAAGRAQFIARLDADVRARTLSPLSADRLRAEYETLVSLEGQYGADGVYTVQERTALRQRYDDLTDLYSQGGPAVGGGPTAAQGQAAFLARVEAAVSARLLTRAEATRLRNDYAAVVRLETTYALGGISANEQADLDARLDALDERVPDVRAPAPLTQRERLDRIQAWIPTAQRSGFVTASQAAELRLQIGDLIRLEAAYSRARPPADDAAYLERRIRDIEARTRIAR